MRLFTAFELPPDVRSEVERTQASLRSLPFKRWQSMKTLHLTLHFLGEVDPGLREPLEMGLGDACRAQSPFRLALGSVGAFPNLKRPRTLWLGLEGDRQALLAFEATIRPILIALDIPLESRPYAPHITLARDPQGPVSVPEIRPLPLEWQVSELVLFQSTLDRSGAIHTPLARFPLG